MITARQSTARTFIVGPVLDASGVAVTDGVIADFKISKNGGAPAAFNGSATLTHRHTGFYSLAATTSDLDTVGQAEVTIDDTVNTCPMKEITVVEEAVYDAFFAASALGFALTSDLTAPVADSVPADGSRPSIAQGIYMAVQFLLERSVSGTTMTIKKPDGTTTLYTITSNDPTNPTTLTRTS